MRDCAAAVDPALATARRGSCCTVGSHRLSEPHSGAIRNERCSVSDPESRLPLGVRTASVNGEHSEYDAGNDAESAGRRPR